MALLESPLEIVLEFARVEATGDAHSFRFARQSYVVRTQRGGFGASELAWNEELLAKLAAVRLSGQDPALLAELGELMRRFLAPAGWELHEQQLAAAMQQRRSVHITIRSAAAELYALPWELLTLRATGQSLGGWPGVLVRYAWPETETAVCSDLPSSAGRIIVAWSAAGGGVPANEHLAAIRAAATAGGLAGRSSLEEAFVAARTALGSDAERLDPSPGSAGLAVELAGDPRLFPRGCACLLDNIGCEDADENMNCANGIDDDQDGLIDAEDPGCGA